MLQLKKIKKSYTVGDFTQIALNGVNLSFRKNEFVAILGPSGSGKTTALNMIGGLDQYDSGDLIINGKSTKNFKDKDWDAYRNNSIGYIFQSYNLITHLTLLDNVEMGMTLSGISNSEKRRKALEVLERVGLKDHVNKKPNQLSGGQMQRVAIARALANDPDIILADEPTGALDTKTSVQIMELIKDIAKDKLVIMVTHNPELAEEYADRIVNFRDGEMVDDTNPYLEATPDANYSLKETSMSFLTALKLSSRNISTKKWRTGLTAFASSIGIIGIALILSLSTGFSEQIDEFQQNALAELPIIISQSAMNVSMDRFQENFDSMFSNGDYLIETDAVYLFDPAETTMIHTNVFSEVFMAHLGNLDAELVNSIGFTRLTNMNVLREIDGEYMPISLTTNAGSMGGPMGGLTSSSFPETLGEGSISYLEQNYDLLAGVFPTNATDLVLVINEENQLDYAILENLGFNGYALERIDFDDIIGTTFRLITNNDFYTETELGNFLPNQDFETMYHSDNSMTLTITGVVRLNSDVPIGLLNYGIAHSDALISNLIDIEIDSDIVMAQREADQNIITFEAMSQDDINLFIATLGGDATPFSVAIYPQNFDAKEAVITYLEAFNAAQNDETYMIIWTDLAATMSEMTGGIMDGITIVLIAFASISLIVSLIMIAIITYISVMERTKEIGILRALGARKRDITRVFNAETFIIGLCSGAIAIGITLTLILPINSVLEDLTGLTGVAQLDPLYAIMLVLISLALTLLGGMIPSRMASKKDPVEALRTE